MQKIAMLLLAAASMPVLAGEFRIAPVAAPTLGEYGLIALAGIVGVAAAMVLRKKK